MSGAPAPAEASVEFSPEVVSGPTNGSPTTVRITLTNAASTTREFGFGDPPPFQGGVARTDERTLYLVDQDEHGVNPTDERLHVPKERTGGCWTILGEPVYNDLGVVRTLEPDESISNEYVVLPGSDDGPCPARGSYEFSTTFTIGPIDGDVREYDWSFEADFGES